ncbi:RNA-binding cell elongation regulator Jag/EloR [Desulfonatronum thiodismutans]|uniref:RNA-binding cell elongation regulator Jag/EloR n=1 Tax=Desulfonatronum thiodismutans TaxID=159290 RepID=UPI00068AFA58|nr:RNA-binding cell elongation regulator Jag/EloR [Desulfonatronum thiodismutans]
MSEPKEFQSKSVDEAIEEACSFFSCIRDELEITILAGGSSGIFGLVGAKKARIKAQPRVRLSELETMIRAVTERITAAIVDNPRVEVEHQSDLIKATIKTSDDMDRLLGREGQVLGAVEYVVNRIVARRWPSAVRVMLDADGFRERQDQELSALAVTLAEKAKSTQSPQSTKPLPSYQRRIVHVALQAVTDIQTKSKGDGPLKRVLIIPKAPPSQDEAPKSESPPQQDS